MNDSCVPDGSVTDFEIGRTTLCEEDADVTMNPPCILSQVWINFVFAWGKIMSRLTLMLYFRSCRGPCSRVWNKEQFHWSWDEEVQKVDECQDNSMFGPFSAKCVSPNWLRKPRAPPCIIGTGFRRWYVSIRIRMLLVPLRGVSSIPLFCFRPLPSRFRYYAHERNGSPARHTLPLHLCGR